MNSRTLSKIESRSRRSESGSTRKAIFLKSNVVKIPDRGEKTIQSIGETVLKAAAQGKRLNDLVQNNSNNVLEQFITEWRVWVCCPKNLRHLLAPIRQFGFTEKGTPYTIMKKLEVFSEEEVDEFDCTYGCIDIDQLGEILENDYNVQIWNDFGDDTASLCVKFGLGMADFDSNCGNLGFDYDEVTGEKRVRFIDYGFKAMGAKDDRWNPLISELISA